MENPGMDSDKEIKRLRAALQSSEKIQAVLDRTVFSLRTLQDISADIYSSIETEEIMHKFLLMCMGNFAANAAFSCSSISRAERSTATPRSATGKRTGGPCANWGKLSPVGQGRIPGFSRSRRWA